MTRRREAGILGIVLALVLVTPAGAADRPRIRAEGEARLPLPTEPIDVLSGLDIPEELIRGLEEAQKIGLEEFSFGHPVHDLTGDGLSEVVIYHYTFSVDPQASTGQRTDLRLSAHDGAGGRRLWSRRMTFEGSGGAYAFGATTGKDASNGLMIVTVREAPGSLLQSSTVEYRVEALTGRGRRLWSRSFESTWVYAGLSTMVITGLLSLSTFDGIGGRQTDLLVGSGEHVETGFTSVTDLSVQVVDGRHARSTDHPQRIHSIGHFPFLGPVGDLDNDAKKDYVITMAGPYTGTDDEDNPIVTLDGVLLGRRGEDGAALWDTPLDVGRFAFAGDGGDITASDTPDILLLTVDFEITELLGLIGFAGDYEADIHLIEGSRGEHMWSRPGSWAYPPGDIDRDGSRDVLILRDRWANDYVATRLRAYNSYGELIYKREYRLEHDLGAASTWAAIGWWTPGDVHPDALEDLFLRHGIGTGPVAAEEEGLVVDARDGNVDVRLGRGIYPLGRPLRGRGTDLFEGCWQPPGAMAVAARGGSDGRRLWARSLSFPVPLAHRRVEMWASSGRLSRGEGWDVLLNLNTLRAGYVIALDGVSGELLWYRQIHGLEARPRLSAIDDFSCD